MQIGNIKSYQQNRSFQSNKTSTSKSISGTDINQLILALRDTLQSDNTSKQKQKYVENSEKVIQNLEKGKLYCQIIEHSHNNKPNQLQLCSILGIPFVSGPAAISSINVLSNPKLFGTTQNQSDNLNSTIPKRNKQTKFKKQLLPLIKYLQKIKEKQHYYCWIIYQDHELGILNVKLFTKSQFYQLKKHHDSYYHSVNSNKIVRGNKNKLAHSFSVSNHKDCKFQNETTSQNIRNEVIQWNKVLVGIFIGCFREQESRNDRIQSALNYNTVNITTKTVNQGLSTKTTQDSLKQVLYTPSKKKEQIVARKQIVSYQQMKHNNSQTTLLNSTKTVNTTFKKSIKSNKSQFPDYIKQNTNSFSTSTTQIKTEIKKIDKISNTKHLESTSSTSTNGTNKLQTFFKSKETNSKKIPNQNITQSNANNGKFIKKGQSYVYVETSNN